MKRARMKSLRHRSGLLWIVNLILIFGLVLTFGCSSEREDSVQQDSALRGPRAHDQAGNTLDEGEKTSRDRVDTSRDQLLDQSEMPPRDDADSAVVPVGDLADSSRSELIEYSESRAELGDLESASSALQIALLRDPADVEILFRLAGLRASVGEFSEAIDLLDGIPMNHPEAGLAALGQKADWCLQLQRYDRAEEHY
ncbi:MAG: tetratricopeptide repeat protein, partial [Rubripirellula sp.]|nr:tetratricopeptide repeat protein [Rubripirellula sp.]